MSGTLEPRKSLATLVEAWREVPPRASQSKRWIWCLPDAAAPIILRCRMNQASIFWAKFPTPNFPPLYSEALAFVYPSFYEGFGLPVLEAMQCGACVIASRAVAETAGGLAAISA